jgi:glycosyltransferase involved in cell wall biosynthesis
MTKKIIVVIPVFKVAQQIEKVIDDMPDFIDEIIVVDDACPEQSGKLIDNLGYKNITIIYHKKNQGTGGAMITGFKKALAMKADIIVKVDGDGQMDLSQMKALIEPLEQGFDYAKGNRFLHFESLKNMPKSRLIGNALLSFFLKIASGYWFVNDVANGYRAITNKALKSINLDKMPKRYFFDLEMIIQLGINRLKIKEVTMPAIYEDEQSSMSILKVLFTFPSKILKGFIKRLLLQYFVYDFNMASVYLLIGIPMLLWGSSFGLYRWYLGMTEGLINNAGVVMSAILPLIIGIQFITQAISIDIQNTPKK